MRNSIKILTVFFLFSVLVAGTKIYSAQQSVTELKEISFQKTKINRVDIFLKIEDAVQYETVDLNVPKKIAIDFSPIQKISVEPWFEIQDINLLGVRVEQVQPEVVRVVLDFANSLPDFKITPVETGLKIELVFEETLIMEQETNKIEPAEVKPAVIEEKAQKETSKDVPSRKKESNYYLGLKGGIGNLIESDIHAQNSFQLYGETGTLTEHYRMDDPKFIFDVIIGRLFSIKNVNFKGSLGISIWTLENDGNFQLSLPHPFIFNTMRSQSFTENYSSSYNAFYISPQVSIFKKNDIQIWAGPIIGFAGGKISTFEDLDFTDNYPFSSSDITITSKSYVEEKFSSLWWGLSGSFEYRFSRPLSLFVEINYIKFSPTFTNLDQKINLSRYQLFLGLHLYL